MTLYLIAWKLVYRKIDRVSKKGLWRFKDGALGFGAYQIFARSALARLQGFSSFEYRILMPLRFLVASLFLPRRSSSLPSGLEYIWRNIKRRLGSGPC